MKKIIFSLLFIVLLAGCGKEETPKVFNEPKEVDKKEEAVNNLLGGDPGPNCHEILVIVNPTGVGVGAYEKNDIVTIQPCGHSWGIGELDETRFKIKKVPKLSKKEIQEYMSPATNTKGEMIKRRKYKINNDVFKEKEYDQKKPPIEKK